MGRSLYPPPPLLQNIPQPHSKILHDLLWPDLPELRQRAMQLLKHPIFKFHYGETVSMERERTRARIRHIAQQGFLKQTIAPGNSQGSRRYDALIDVIALFDHSLEVLMGVNFGLFGSTVKSLGSPKQYNYWLPRLENLESIGCFALTELGHGSNVRGIETQATYDKASQQFTIHTPNEMAQKYWIGAAAELAEWAVVFAQLTINNTNQGIHVFLVQLRDKSRVVQPGIQIADCGVKAGLNGVDNGRIWFTNCRVPRENMLCKMSQVAPDGTYTTSIPSSDARFSAQLAALTGGRVGIAKNAVSCAQLGLIIAIRYSFQRTAFAPSPKQKEVPLMFYTSHQRRLMVPLATSFIYHFCARDLREMWYANIDDGSVSKSVHTLSAGYKAMFTWFMQDALQVAREACGGQGYKSENRIAVLKADRDVMMTFEGANGILLQQVAKGLMSEVGAAMKRGGIYPESSNLAILNHVPLSSHSAKSLDASFVLSAFCKREKKLLEALGTQYVAALRARRGSAFNAWNDCLHIAESASLAHMQRRILQSTELHLKRAYQADESVGEAMQLCSKLWAADVIAKDPDFLRLHCMSAGEVNDILGQIGPMCTSMTSIADSLMDGIGFPDHIMAPIALDFLEHNSRAKL